MPKVIMVTECGDPYEPSATIAIVNTIAEAKALGFKELWEHVGKEMSPSTDWMPNGIEVDVYKDHISGATFKTHDGAGYPQPLIERVETGVIIGKSEYTSRRWYNSPNRKRK